MEFLIKLLDIGLSPEHRARVQLDVAPELPKIDVDEPKLMWV